MPSTSSPESSVAELDDPAEAGGVRRRHSGRDGAEGGSKERSSKKSSKRGKDDGDAVGKKAKKKATSSSSSSSSSKKKAVKKTKKTKGGCWGCMVSCMRVMYSVVILGLLAGAIGIAVWSVSVTHVSRCYGTAFADVASRGRLQATGAWQGYGTGPGKCERKEYWDSWLLGDRSLYGRVRVFQGDYVDGVPEGKGEYVAHTAYLDFVRPPYHGEGADKIYYVGDMKAGEAHGHGRLEVTPTGMKYMGTFEHGEFAAVSESEQQIDLGFVDVGKRAKMIGGLSGARLGVNPIGTQNAHALQVIRYRGPTAARGVPQGEGGRLLLLSRSGKLSSEQNWTRIVGDWENGELVRPTSVEAVRGEVRSKATRHVYTVRSWTRGAAGTSAVLVDDTGAELKWDGTYVTGPAVDAHDQAELKKAEKPPKSQYIPRYQPVPHEMADALEALRIFEDHVRDAATMRLAKVELEDVAAGPVRSLKESGDWDKYSPANAKKDNEGAAAAAE